MAVARLVGLAEMPLHLFAGDEVGTAGCLLEATHPATGLERLGAYGQAVTDDPLDDDLGTIYVVGRPAVIQNRLIVLGRMLCDDPAVP